MSATRPFVMRVKAFSLAFLVLGSTVGLAASYKKQQSGLLLPFPEGTSPDGTRYKTDYKCQGENMTVTCEDGSGTNEAIEVVRGNFGRFSIAICNRHGNTDWSVNCMAPATTKILKERCDGRTSCTIPVQSSLFPDACPGTMKYLEIHYACSAKSAGNGNGNKNRRVPPWLQKSGERKGVFRPKLIAPIQTNDSKPNRKTNSKKSNGRGPPLDVGVASTTPVPRKPILVTEKEETQTPRVPITTPTPPAPPRRVTTPKVKKGLEERPRNGNKGSHKPSSATEEHSRISSESGNSPDQKISPSSGPVNSQDRQGIRQEGEDTYRHQGTLETGGDTSSDGRKAQDELYVGPPPSSKSTSFNPSLWCPPSTARKLQWDWTPAGKEVVQPCPIGATGHARWACLLVESEDSEDIKSRWAEPQPDMSHCKSVAMSNLEAQVRKEDPENVIVSALAYLTRTKSLFGGDLETAVTTMRTVANRIQYRLQQSSRLGALHNKESHIRQVLQNVFRSANNVLERSNRQAWLDLNGRENGGIGHANAGGQMMKVATQLMLSLEENAFLLASVMNDPEVVLESSDILTMAISVVDIGAREKQHESRDGASINVYTPDFQFPAKGSNLLYVDDSIQLSERDARAHSQGGGLAEAVFFSYGNLHEILARARIDLSQHRAHSSDGQNGDKDKLVLNSRVISASLGRAGRHVELIDPVRVTLRHIDTDNMTGAVCVYWDIEEHAWSDSGCHVVQSNASETLCQCSHLTNFAVLMRPADPLSDSAVFFNNILERIDVFGSVLAAILVFILVLIFMVFRHRLGSCCSCCPPVAVSTMPFCLTKGSQGLNTGDVRKSQSFYTGLNAVNGSNSGSSGSSKSRNLLLNNSQRASSQYVLSTQTLQNGAMGTVRITPPNTQAHTMLLPPGHAHAGQKPRPHITLNPYSTQLVDNINMMMPNSSSSSNNNTGSSSLDSAASGGHQMSPQLLNLTQTLKGSVGGQEEVIYRAVSPHGHVYWEIDPASVMLLQNQNQGQIYEETPGSALDNLEPEQCQPLIAGYHNSNNQQPLLNMSDQQHLALFNQQQLMRASNSSELDSRTLNSRGGAPGGSGFVRNGANRFNSRQRRKNSGVADQGGAANNVPETLQQQVQIRDCKPIQVSVKSSEYIEAKIRTLRKNNLQH